jgi:hypothetical protein
MWEDNIKMECYEGEEWIQLVQNRVQQLSL